MPTPSKTTITISINHECSKKYVNVEDPRNGKMK